jgi:hypothetical protein
LDGRGSILGGSKISLFSIASRDRLWGTAQPSVQCVPEVKRQRREADHSPPSSVEVNNGGAIPPFLNTSPWRGE